MTRKCECKFCKRHERIKKATESLPEEIRAEILEIWSEAEEDLEVVSTELSWHKSVIDGSWPRAKEIRSNWVSTWDDSGVQLDALKAQIEQLKEDRKKLLDAANDGGFWPDVTMEQALGREVV